MPEKTKDILLLTLCLSCSTVIALLLAAKVILHFNKTEWCWTGGFNPFGAKIYIECSVEPWHKWQ